MSRAVEQTVSWCRCDERNAAHVRGEFNYSWEYRAWFFPHDPKRRMSTEAYFLAIIDRGKEFPFTDHIGEPVLHHDCPWCGAILPGMGEAQADGTA